MTTTTSIYTRTCINSQKFSPDPQQRNIVEAAVRSKTPNSTEIQPLEQLGHRINPFSLQSKHRRSCPSASMNTFRLPRQFAHGTNLTSPQLEQTFAGSLTGKPCRTFLNSPVSSSCRTSSAPPTCRPRTKTCGSPIGFSPSTA